MIRFMSCALYLALIVLLASRFVEGFSIDNFWWGLLFSLLLSLIMSIIDKKVADKKK